MKGLLALLAGGAVLFIGYVIFTGGSLNKGGATGGNSDAVKDGGHQVIDKGQDTWAQLATQPWFYTAVAAAIIGTLGLMFWRRIGNFGRMMFMLLFGIGLAIFLFKVGR